MRLHATFSRGVKLRLPPLPPFRFLGAKARRAAVVVGALGGAFVTGYLVAALFIFPAPLLTGQRTVPRLIGLERAQARQELFGLSLEAVDGGEEAHDAVAKGHVVWQDPPPGVVVPERTTVTLVTSAGPAAAIVPDVTGLGARLAQRIVEAAGLRVRGVDSVQAPAPRGVIVLSRPRAGTPLTPGTGVILTVSRGEATIVVPNVMGLSLGDAGTAIESAGLSLGSSWSRTEPSATPGTVVEQRPAAGTLAAPQSPVDLIFARRRPQ